MKFVCTLYILIVLFAENKEKLLVRCTVDLEESELVYLSQKLSIFECMQLLKSVYEFNPGRVIRKFKKREVLDENLNHLSTTSKECLLDLEQWNHDFPKDAKFGGRSTMEMSLRWLGRADLAKYVRDNRRSINFLNTNGYDVANVLEFPEHIVLRRHTSENGKHSSTKGKKKKKKEKRPHHKNSHAHQKNSHAHQKNSHAHQRNSHNQHSSKRKKKDHGDISITRQVTHHTTHHMKKHENKERKKKYYIEQHRSVCCSILFVLLFVIFCLVTAYLLRRRHRLMARGTRFKYNRNTIKHDKDTCTDNLDWNDDVVCSCSDVDVESTLNCSLCKRNRRIKKDPNDQYGSDLNTTCGQKTKNGKGKRKQRFSFLPKNFQDKKREKDQENTNRKCVRRQNAGTIEYENQKCIMNILSNNFMNFHLNLKTAFYT